MRTENNESQRKVKQWWYQCTLPYQEYPKQWWYQCTLLYQEYPRSAYLWMRRSCVETAARGLWPRKEVGPNRRVRCATSDDVEGDMCWSYLRSSETVKYARQWFKSKPRTISSGKVRFSRIARGRTKVMLIGNKTREQELLLQDLALKRTERSTL